MEGYLCNKLYIHFLFSNTGRLTSVICMGHGITGSLNNLHDKEIFLIIPGKKKISLNFNHDNKIK